ncbi:hypothetical protein [Pseudoduganella namucuonensis]|nr:hypothetical protein [Pseudoduganella namucuonensis]
MHKSLTPGFLSEQPGRAATQPASAGAGHGLDDGFPWYRIRRLAKKD